MTTERAITADGAADETLDEQDWEELRSLGHRRNPGGIPPILTGTSIYGPGPRYIPSTGRSASVSRRSFTDMIR
jgi:hypothetical protein